MSHAGRHATRHWRNQRFSALALVPLSLWFLWSLLSLPDRGHATVTAWLGQPLQAGLAWLFAWSALWHSMQGLQVVIEDYVEGALQTPLLVTLRLLHAAGAIAAAAAVWIIATGGAT